MRILKALLIKEFIMLRRDAFLLRTIILLPLVVMLVLPLVANMDVKNAGIAVVDNDMSQLSRRIIADMDASEHLSVSESSFTYGEAMAAIGDGRADAMITIPQGYARQLQEGHLPSWIYAQTVSTPPKVCWRRAMRCSRLAAPFPNGRQRPDTTSRIPAQVCCICSIRL